MAYETKFVSGADAKTLTERVQKEEKDGWEYADVKITAAPARDGDEYNFHVYMLAVLRRPLEQDAPVDQQAAGPSGGGGTRGQREMTNTGGF